MLAVSPAAKLVLDGVTYAASVKVTLGLPGGVYPDVSLAVSGLTITRAKATDGPDQSTYQVGWPSWSADFTLSGIVDKTDAGKTAAWLFGRWQTSSPLWRTDALLTPVTIDVVLAIPGATETIRQFTGYVTYYKRSGAVVDVTCSDRSVLLRKSSVSVPAVATAAPWNAGLTSEYALDAVARDSTGGVVSTWPKTRTNCVLAAGLRTSLWPEVGTLQTSGYTQPVPAYKAGAFGSALTSYAPGASGGNYIGYSLAAAVGDDFFVEFWITGNGRDTNTPSIVLSSGTEILSINLKSASVTVQPSFGGLATFPVTWSGGATYLALKAHVPAGGANWNGTLYVNGATQASGSLILGSGGTANAHYDSASVSVYGQTTFEALQISNEASPTPSFPFTPQAVFDPSLNVLEVVPSIDPGTDPRGLLATIAAAELGNISFDEYGILRFVNRNTWTGGALTRTITSSNLAALSEETTSASVINHAQVGFTGWSTQAAQTVWSLTRPWRIPAHSTGSNAVIRYVTLPDVTVNVPAAVPAYPNSGAPTAGSNAYGASVDKAGVTPHPGLTITASQVGSRQVKLRIVNATAQTAYLVSPYTATGLGPGTPTLIIGGQPVTQDTEAIADYQYPAESDGGAISTRFGEQLWSFTGSSWIQDADTAQQLAQDAVFAGYVPRPNLTDLAVTPPDPRIQSGDLVRALDTVTTVVDEYVRSFGGELSVNGTTWSQSIDARAVAAPGGLILDVAGRSELNTAAAYLPG